MAWHDFSFRFHCNRLLKGVLTVVDNFFSFEGDSIVIDKYFESELEHMDNFFRIETLEIQAYIFVE